jgi:DNA-binding MarR family transcriptional regulator
MKLDSFQHMYDMPGYLLRRAGQFVTATFDAEMRGMGITASQVAVFLAVHVQSGLQQRELSAALSWDEATVGGMVRRLEAQGLLERKPTPRSRRGRAIYLTPAGEQFYRRIAPHVAKVQKKLLKAFTADERDQFLHLLSKMLEVDNSHAGEASGKQPGKRAVAGRAPARRPAASRAMRHG